MKQILSYIIAMLLLIACSTQESTTETGEKNENKKYAEVSLEKDSLFSISNENFEYGTACGYRTSFGDTVIEEGKFDACFTDTFVNFAYVFDKELFGSGMVAINRKQQVIFDAYLFDNGPDYISEGLFRIMRNGKIGYADASGKIVIAPTYTCAYAFENGKAKVALDCKTVNDEMEHSSWESDAWFYIDKHGKKIK